VQTKVSHVVQEAIVVIKDVFRKYPNKYESVIGTLCENLESPDSLQAPEVSPPVLASCLSLGACLPPCLVLLLSSALAVCEVNTWEVCLIGCLGGVPQLVRCVSCV
jgi:hypothetical protein